MSSVQPRIKEWRDGDLCSPNELCIKFGITRDEFTAFKQCIRIYPYGKVIIQEGDLDKTLYLLRSGSVGVFRQVSGRQEQIAKIEAVNFMGEMSLVNDEPRNATVITQSDDVLVYAITQPNLNLILASPKWAEMLISRLCKDLTLTNSHLVAMNETKNEMQAEIAQLKAELNQAADRYDDLMHNAAKACSGIMYFQGILRDQAIVGSKGWSLLRSIIDMTRLLMNHYIPGLSLSEANLDLKFVQECLASIHVNGSSLGTGDLNRSNKP